MKVKYCGGVVQGTPVNITCRGVSSFRVKYFIWKLYFYVIRIVIFFNLKCED